MTKVHEATSVLTYQIGMNGLPAGHPGLQAEVMKWGGMSMKKLFDGKDADYKNVDMELLHKEYDQAKKEVSGPQIGA